MLDRICWLILINLVVYFRTLRYKYCSDDLAVFKNPPKFYNSLHKRFLQFLGTAKVKEEQDHLITIAIHTLNCVFLYLGMGASDISFLAGVLFAINPANNQGSIWMAGRGYASPLMFMLMAKTFPVLAIVFLFCATHFAVGFPALIVFIGSQQWFLLAYAPLMWFLHFDDFKAVVGERRGRESTPEDRRIKPRKLILAFKTFGFYLSLALIPFRLTFYHSYLQSAAGNPIMRKRAYQVDKFFWVGVLAVLGWGVYSLRQWDTISYGLFWFMVSVAPFCNFIRLQQEIAERYIYFANAGLMLALATMLVHFPIATAVFLTVYLVRLWYFMPAYTWDYWLLEHSVIESPGSWYVWHVRAINRWTMGSPREALNMWVMAQMLSPKEFKVLVNIGMVLKVLRRDKEADTWFEKAKENIIEGQEEQAKQIFEDIKAGKLPLLV